MTIEEIDKLFEVDENGRFLRLVIPRDTLGDELNLIGKKRLDLDINVVVRIKKYAGKLYEEAIDV